MAPGHVAPLVALGVVLEEQVPFATVVDEAVRIVQPVAAGGEMELGTKQLTVDFHSGCNTCRTQERGQ